MNNRRPLAVVGALAAIIVIVAAGTWAVTLWSAHNESSVKADLASGYEAHSLIPPFALASKTWASSGGLFSSSGTWTYRYTASVSGPDALAAAQKQLGQGGYQVVATRCHHVISCHAVPRFNHR